MKKQFFLEENGAILKPKGKKQLDVFNRILACLLLVVAASFLWFCISHSLKVVEGLSMQPTINKTYVKHKQYDIVLYNKFQTAKRSDIIILNFADHDTQHPHVIKRVIAKEGDKLNIEWNNTNQKLVVTLNGQVLEENYTLKDPDDPQKDHKDSKTCATKFQNNKYYWDVEIDESGAITIPKGCIFALGDNRTNSEDCSNVGPIKESNVLGVVDTLIANGTFLNSAIKFLFALD